ncbi:MAG: DEAD/DEAH box helicase [Ignavibacteria bacterium]|jgi:ATP-dependent RNA helicase DeaD|nr:DEAD/DEAH box helicase [Ignavibacteria bacterium]
MDSELLKLSKPMLALLLKQGITVATPVQKEIIPAILDGRDIIAQSETGSGKTLSFAVPLIERINPSDGLKALILVPTRELCVQVTHEFSKFSLHRNFAATAIYGGVSISDQVRKMKRTNVIVATPGRLLDLLERKAFNLSKIEYLVFDEADRMLDMGFVKDIERILKLMPQKKQTMLFSATISKDIARLSKKYLDNPFRVTFDTPVQPGFLRQTYYQTVQSKKMPLLIHLLKNDRELTIVFCNRKHITEKLAKNLTAEGVVAKCLNGDMTQAKREKVTKEFRDKRFSVLIATDVASRGLHIEGISHVYNYEIPKDVESYTHRVGRTARAGKKGEAISLVTPGEDQKFFKQILFTQKGIITLKSVDDALLPGVKEPSKSVHVHTDQKGRRESSRSSESGRQKSSGGREYSGNRFSNKRRPGEEGNSERRQYSGERSTERRQSSVSRSSDRRVNPDERRKDIRRSSSSEQPERRRNANEGSGRSSSADKIYQFDDKKGKETMVWNDIYAGFRDKNPGEPGKKSDKTEENKSGKFKWFSGDKSKSFRDKNKPGDARKKKFRK